MRHRTFRMPDAPWWVNLVTSSRPMRSSSMCMSYQNGRPQGHTRTRYERTYVSVETRMSWSTAHQTRIAVCIAVHVENRNHFKSHEFSYLDHTAMMAKNLEHFSCEFDKLWVDTHLCKLRDTPAARLSYGFCQGEHQQTANCWNVSYYTYFIYLFEVLSCGFKVASLTSG